LPGVPPLPTGGLVPIGEVAAAAFVKNSESEVVPMAGNPGDIPVVFFFPQGKQKELDQMKKKFADIIKKHKLKFSLIPTLEVPYPQTADLSYDLFVQNCQKAQVNVAIVLGPSLDGSLGEALFFSPPSGTF
jgi:hypothetical protein